MCLDGGHDENQLEHFLNHSGEGASAILFGRTVCGAHLAYAESVALMEPTAGTAGRAPAAAGRVCRAGGAGARPSPPGPVR
jgi:hypothetical protein